MREPIGWLKEVDREILVLTLGDGFTPLVLTNQNWQWNVVGGAAEFLFPLGLLAFMRLDVDLGRELSQPLREESVGSTAAAICTTLWQSENVSPTNNTAWARLLQT